tara:strand:+ start:809 stop:1102 length:294 start_codon:yes stop_codon:yes gene_type:complete
MQSNKQTLEKILKKYKLVEVHWWDITSESGWQSIEEAKNVKLAVCITKGHLLSKSKGIYRIFGDYALEDDKKEIAEIGNLTIIPKGCVIEIKDIKTK